jgi:hypothetical protein
MEVLSKTEINNFIWINKDRFLTDSNQTKTRIEHAVPESFLYIRTWNLKTYWCGVTRALIFCFKSIQLTDMDGTRDCEACGSVFLKNKVRHQKCSREKCNGRKKLKGKCSNTVFCVTPCNNAEIAVIHYIHYQEQKCMMKLEWL